MKDAQLCKIKSGPSHVADVDLEVLQADGINAD